MRCVCGWKTTASAHQDRIFQVFERLHGVEEYPGTGIGLGVVAKGAMRMGGRYGVESALGEGSRFWVELPRGGAVSPQPALEASGTS